MGAEDSSSGVSTPGHAITRSAVPNGDAGFRGLRVKECDPSSDPRWDRFVADHEDGHFYHSAGWLEVVTELTGHVPIALTCEDGTGRVVGVLPMVLRPVGVLNRRARYYSSLPHTPYAGPLAETGEVYATLLGAAAERVAHTPGSWLSVRSTVEDLGQWLPLSVTTRTTYVLELPPPDQPLRFGDSRNHGAIRRAVRKAARTGVRVRPAETESDLRAWYQLYLETMRWHVVLPWPYRMFVALWRALGPRGHVQLLLAEQEGRTGASLLAGSLFLRFGGRVMYAKNGRQQGQLAARPNDAIFWHSIHEASAAGYRYYDFGEVRESNEGLGRFKSKWGAQPQPFFSYQHPVTDALAQAQRTRAPRPWSSQRLAVARRHLWHQFPLRATAAVGERWYSWY